MLLVGDKTIIHGKVNAQHAREGHEVAKNNWRTHLGGVLRQRISLCEPLVGTSVVLTLLTYDVQGRVERGGTRWLRVSE